MNNAVELIRKKWLALKDSLDERARRLWAGIEADALGRGGLVWVAEATGLALSTVGKGKREAREGVSLDGRVRRPGAGRKRAEVKDPQLIPALNALVHPSTRGDPESPLLWTNKSTPRLAAELTSSGHPVSATTVAELLRKEGYSLQSLVKTKEGNSHPDRDEQFEHINTKAQDFLSKGLPVISVDAKKKEFLGERSVPGREWQQKSKPVEVVVHDYFDTGGPHATPFGIYDVEKNAGFVNVGTDRNTPTFAVRSISKWWDQAGSQQYPAATELLVTADAGGSNAAKSRVWKYELQKLADRTGLAIHVSHFPPGTSKWNKIEHRLFSFITMNWRGRPLVSHEVVVKLIAATTTTKGLRVHAQLDTEKYVLGVKVPHHEFASMNIERATFHGDWNYILRPRTAAQREEAATAPVRNVITRAEANAKWKEFIRQQIQSGLSGRAFCKRRGLNYWTFTSARRRLIGKIRDSPNTTK